MPSSLQDLIKAKQKKISDKKAGSVRTHKPAIGSNTYRLLPGFDPNNRNQCWQDFGMHWIKKEIGGKPVAVHLCEAKTHEEACDICAAIGQAMASSQNDEQVALLKEANSSQRYLLNALHLNGESPNEPIVLEVGTMVFEAIAEIIGEYGEITDLEEGTNIKIKRDGTGIDTSYTVTTAAKKTVVKKEVLDRLHNLAALVEGQRDATKHQASLTNIASIVGLELAESARLGKSSTKSIAKDLDEEIDIEEDDVPFEEGSTSESAAEAEDIDDDMLDELMSS